MIRKNAWAAATSIPKPDFFQFDFTRAWQSPKAFLPGGSLQPYISFLSDRTGRGKRNNLFAVQTRQDLLGTFGADLNMDWNRFSFGFEAARNFGEAQVTGDGEDVLHKGYLIYSDAVYDLQIAGLKPHTKFLLASGNDLGGSEGGTIPGSSNRAFSNYSPLNTYLSDSVYQAQAIGPPVATGNVSGLHYGIPRPGTFGNPYLSENIITPNAGLEFKPHTRFTVNLDWWYLAAFERGVGSLTDQDGNAVSRKLSRDLGNELDALMTIQITAWLSLRIFFGYYMPGDYYKEARDDSGSSFSPLIRGGGDVDNVFYSESRLIIQY